jgi:D-beta-D-heptose 7-phosphate kinase/D-beta-D-heptose 1-phosphate adenosyltransferase
MECHSLLVERFKGLHVTVIGDVLLDTFVECSARKLCSEGPVPVVWRGPEVAAPGGAANVAANLAGLGARVRLVGVTGRDAAGELLRARLVELGVGTTALLARRVCQTHHKMRILADGHYVVRVDEGDTDRRDGGLWAAVQESLVGADAVVLSDYGLGVLHEWLIGRLARVMPDVPVVVDAKRPRRFRRLRPTAVTPNLEEATALAGAAVPPDRLARRVRRATAAQLVALTMGCQGAYLLDGSGRGEMLPARPGPAESVVGAGDSFAAALALGLAAQAPASVAAAVAVETAGIAVAKRYTAVVTAPELRRSLAPAVATGDGDPRARPALAELLPTLERPHLVAHRPEAEGPATAAS